MEENKLNAADRQLTRFLMNKAARRRIPLSGTFELTARCNLNCRMCYVRRSAQQVKEMGGELSEKDWLKLAEEARKEGMLLLLLTGGEPFLLENFKSLYTELSQMGFLITINSNGTMIDEKCVEWLEKTPPSRMRITLYGGNDDTYTKLCRQSGMFDRTTKAIKLLKEANILTRVMTTLTPYNAGDYEQIIGFANELDMPFQMSSYIFPPYRRDEKNAGEAVRLSPQEAARFTVLSDRMNNTKEGFLNLAEYRMQQSDSVEDFDEECIRDDKLPMRCHAGRSTFWINWQGKMTPCGMLSYPVEEPLKIGFKTAWNKIAAGIDELLMPSKCNGCKYSRSCPVCGAAVFCETGEFAKVPSYCCDMAKATDEITREMYNAIKKENENV